MKYSFNVNITFIYFNASINIILERVTDLQLTYMSINGVEEVRAVQFDWWRTW